MEWNQTKILFCNNDFSSFIIEGPITFYVIHFQLSLPQDDGSNPGTPSSVDGGNVKVSKLWTRKGKQEAGAFLGQFNPSKSGRERRKKNTNYSNIVLEYSRSFLLRFSGLGFGG